MPIGFPDLRVNAPAAPAEGAETRCFMGAGENLLPVPGLRALFGVRMEHATMPLAEMREFCVDPQMTKRISIPTPVFLLDRLPDGSPVLLRNICSNDAVFQAEEPFYITGEWDDGTLAPELPPVEPRKNKKGIR